MVLEIESLAQFEKEIAGPGLVVVDFFTTWCGPCKQIAPFIEQLVSKYPEVKFIKVDIEKNEDIAAPRNIQSIPTFHFYVRGSLKDEMKGANPSALEEKVNALKVNVNPFGGQGNKLATVDTGVPALSAREARLKAFGAVEGVHKAPEPKTATEPAKSSKLSSDDVDEDEALAKALALSMADSSKAAAAAPKAAPKPSAQDAAEFAAMEAEQDALDEQAAVAALVAGAVAGANDDWDGEEMVPVPVNEDLLAQLVDMGFPDVRARKSIVHGVTMDGALAWIADHQDDADIDQPYMVKKSDTVPRAPLSEEERARRVAMIKDKVKERRDERAKEAKVQEIKAEKERRERGQKIDETLEERQRLARKRDAERMKKEKDDANKERLRLRAEIARDKELRKLHKGVLPSVLGVEGYNPSIIQYDVPDHSAPPPAAEAHIDHSVPAKRPSPASSSAPAAAPAAKKPPAAAPVTKKAAPSSSAAADGLDPAAKIDAAIATIARYRSGGDGGAALKLLLTFVRNIVDHPEDPKYRSINTESAAFKGKLGSLVGPAALLRAVGFERNEEEGKLRFDGEVAPDSLLAATAAKLAAAEAQYRLQNP